MTNKKISLIVISVATAFYLPIYVFVFCTIGDIINALAKEDLTLLQPQITYHEFPVNIRYSVDGKEVVIQDVLVCEFIEVVDKDWIERLSTGIKFERRWKAELKSHRSQGNINRIELLRNDELMIDFSFGSANYYMGDIDVGTYYPSFRVFEIQDNEETLQKFTDSPRELKIYGIDVKECILPRPIKNSFGQDKDK